MKNAALDHRHNDARDKTSPALKLSILLTTYNRADILLRTINSIFAQSFQNFEILVWDDCSTDDTEEKVRSIQDPRVIYHRNPKNLGYGVNLQACSERATGDIVYYLGDDDTLLEGALEKTHAAFLRGEHIGFVTRPFFNYWDDPKYPIRTVFPYDSHKDVELSVFDGRKAIEALFSSSWQLSGLALRRKYMDTPIHEDIFPAHVYPVASVLKKYKAVFLKDFTVAILTNLSMSTYKPEIYNKSPIASWIQMFETVYAEPQYQSVRNDGIDFTIRRTLPGLFQIKTSTSNKLVLREMGIIIKRIPGLLFNPSFLMFSVVSLIVPGKLLRKLLDWYKANVLWKLMRSGFSERFPLFWGFGSRF